MLSRRQTWWELMVSPTRSNECYSLELPGGGELPDSSRLDRLVAVAQPQIGLSIGDQTERGKNEGSMLAIGSYKGCLARSCAGRSGGIALF